MRTWPAAAGIEPWIAWIWAGVNSLGGITMGAAREVAVATKAAASEMVEARISRNWGVREEGAVIRMGYNAPALEAQTRGTIPGPGQ